MTEKSLALRSGADGSLPPYLLTSWDGTNPISLKLLPLVPRLIREAKERMKPVSIKALAVLFERCFSVLAMPSEEAMVILQEKLRVYPEDVVATTVEKLIETYVWALPPKVAHFLEIAEPLMRECRRNQTRAYLAELWVRWGRVEPEPEPEISPEDRARNLALLKQAARAVMGAA